MGLLRAEPQPAAQIKQVLGLCDTNLNESLPYLGNC